MPIIYNVVVVEQDPSSSSAAAAVDVKFSEEKYEKREDAYLIVRLEVTWGIAEQPFTIIVVPVPGTASRFFADAATALTKL